jgi:trimethylguanosine synthase
VAIESSPERLAMARNNAAIYEVDDHIDFVNGDFIDLVDTVPAAGAVYLDPPWGGPAYRKQGVFHLSNFEPDGLKLLELTWPRFEQVLLRVPKTFDPADLDGYDAEWQMFDDLSRGRVVSRCVLFTR